MPGDAVHLPDGIYNPRKNEAKREHVGTNHPLLMLQNVTVPSRQKGYQGCHEPQCGMNANPYPKEWFRRQENDDRRS